MRRDIKTIRTEHVVGDKQALAVEPNLGERGQAIEAKVAGLIVRTRRGSKRRLKPPIVDVCIKGLIEAPTPKRGKRCGDSSRDDRRQPSGILQLIGMRDGRRRLCAE